MLEEWKIIRINSIFSLFHCCISRYTGYPQSFMLHRVLFTTCLKSFCYKTISSRLEGGLTCGSFHWCIRWVNPWQTLSFTSPLYNKLILFLKLDVIFQSQPKKHAINPILKNKVLQIVRFWFENSSCGQILNRDSHNASGSYCKLQILNWTFYSALTLESRF